MKKKMIIACLILIIAIVLICIAVRLHSNSNIKIYNQIEGEAFSESGLTIDIHGIYPRVQLSTDSLINSGIPENIAENMISKIRSNNIIIIELSEQENQTINGLYFDYIICDENQNILSSTSQIHYKEYMPIKKAATKLLFNTSNTQVFDDHINYTQASNYLFDDSNKVYALINIDSTVNDIDRLKVLIINPKYNNNEESISFDNTIIKLEGSVTK